jgi:hypothetical protein
MNENAQTAHSVISRSPEFEEWDGKARALANELAAERNRWGNTYRQLIVRRKIWQTVVVISTSVSTGLAGYLVNQETPFQWRLALAIIVAVAGAISAVRDAWQVNEATDNARDRYYEVKTLAGELEKVRFDVAGQIRDSETLPKLRGTVQHVIERLQELQDDLSGGSVKTAIQASAVRPASPPFRATAAATTNA